MLLHTTPKLVRLWLQRSGILNTELIFLVSEQASYLTVTISLMEIAATMYTNVEQWGNVGCPVPNALTNGSAPAPVEGECTMGNMAAYVVKATSAEDVSEAVKFAAKNNLRLRIKNVGYP
jgi:cell division inhibitor SulA